MVAGQALVWVSQVVSLLCTSFIPCEKTYGTPSIASERRLSFREAKQLRSSGSSGHPNELWNKAMPPAHVVTPSGALDGFFIKVTSGRDIYAFEGIPFAEPPVGYNRFRAPVPKKPWEGTLKAHKAGSMCPQQLGIITNSPPRFIGNEDCLFLNVYSPELPQASSNPNLPVLVFIHGGGYALGFGSLYGPAYLLQEDVILVTMNYRLGALGFVSTWDEHNMGNWGLKDQALAIEWVVDNIRQFGGDPTRITVAGQSAGSSSTHLQMMSKYPTKHKFQQAILFSGVASNEWAMKRSESVKNESIHFGRLNGCPTNQGSKVMVDCLRKIDPYVLMSNGLLLPVATFAEGHGNAPGLILPFVPVLEPELPGAFITSTPEELYEKGQVARIPTIFSMTSNEMDSLQIVIKSLKLSGLFRNVAQSLGPQLLNIQGKVANPQETVQKIWKYYGKGRSSIFELPLATITRLASDRFFNNGIYKTIQRHSQIAPTYATIFAYQSPYASRAGKDYENYDVTHSEDLTFLFNSTLFTQPVLRSENGFAIVKLLINLYSNYFSRGEPLYTNEELNDYRVWKPITDPNKVKYLKVDQTVKMVSEPSIARAVRFWDSLGIK